jgi:hypothetical protein
MAVTTKNVAFECAASFATDKGHANHIAVAAIFKTWLDAQGGVAEDNYAALRAACEICDEYQSPTAVTRQASLELASLLAMP